ncbi:MAG: zf-HC2 domain-containing protein [Pseudogulbenkiania sp.]|nr:zf-HC2 domain-containing protein [Pseudogulbenkiania sp.]
MLNCFNATRLLSESLERHLAIKERMALNMHTMMCSGCRNFGKQMQMLRLIAKTYAHKPDEGESAPSVPPQDV